MTDIHIFSSLLGLEEVEIVKKLVELNCKVLASTVARLYYPDELNWTLLGTGLILLVKNFNTKRYYIEFYDVEHGMKMFAEKIGKSFEYTVYDTNIHIIISGFSCLLLSLADHTDGLKFSESMNKLIKNKNAKDSLEKSLFITHEETTLIPSSTEVPCPKMEFIKERKGRCKKSKSDVGLPYNLYHLDHLGQNGFFLSEIKHDDLRKYLSGINMEYLINDKEIERPSQDFLISDTNFYNIPSNKSTNKVMKTKLTKNDIGNPENFIHVKHIGMNDSKHLDVTEETSNVLKNESQQNIVDDVKRTDLKTGKVKFSKSDISIPTNFRHIEHMGDKNPIYDLQECDNE